MSLVQHHEIADLRLSETTGSGGRFLEVEIDLYPPWAGPDDGPMVASASLDVRDAEQLVDAVNGWLDSQGFSR